MTAGCGAPQKDTKLSANRGISGSSPILGYNPANYQACCDRCAVTQGCAGLTWLQRPASVGNLCYLYSEGATVINTLPSAFSTFYSGTCEFAAVDSGSATQPRGFAAWLARDPWQYQAVLGSWSRFDGGVP